MFEKSQKKSVSVLSQLPKSEGIVGRARISKKLAWGTPPTMRAVLWE